MPAGALQLLPNGELVVLGPDRPTVGGYAFVACVASIDLGPLAQRMPNERVAFELITPDAANSSTCDFVRKTSCSRLRARS